MLRRVRNRNFSFSRFIWHDLSFVKDSSGRTNRSRHFEKRLQSFLPWTASTSLRNEVLVDGEAVLLSPVSKTARPFLGSLPDSIVHVADNEGIVDFF